MANGKPRAIGKTNRNPDASAMKEVISRET
jgi:hypothetical protein